ncbi:hypothetical protein, partial [Gilvimarinus sp. 1_MG-2023]|uniref:hypothetical protein n=1 Tax=Gilvimarinus sp. 1_MG-2023 TaxID=3062638 RepID=UPI0026E437FE
SNGAITAFLAWWVGLSENERTDFGVIAQNRRAILVLFILWSLLVTKVAEMLLKDRQSSYMSAWCHLGRPYV